MGSESSQRDEDTGDTPLGDLARGIASIERGNPHARITLVTDDSRAVVPGSLFVAKRGARLDGAAYIADALARGASCVLLENGAPAPALDPRVGVLRADDAAIALARLAERFAGEPSAALRVIGVTGTNGKTTTSTLTRAILDATGSRCGLISTCAIDAGPGLPLDKATQTTPGAVELSRRLAAMRRAGCDAAVVETSSHALDQRRVAAVRYAVAIFTNLTGDHLDYHGDMERYADAKAILFASLAPDARAVVNADDPAVARMVRDCAAQVIACTAGDDPDGAIAVRTGRPGAQVARVRVIEVSSRGLSVEMQGPFGDLRVRLPLHGAHNAMNALQAACAAWTPGADTDAIIDALERAAPPPGRLEPVARSAGVRERVAVLVDYAHTDDALARSLAAVRPLVAPGGMLRVVFGCGGDRDRTKRPRMGAVASSLADDVIVTSDNPRTENPQAIVDEVLAGVSPRSRANAIVDRREAIRAAIARAEPGDVVLIAGKGHEDYQILPDGRGGTVTRHFDDREEARAALLERFGAPACVEPKPPASAAQCNGGGVA